MDFLDELSKDATKVNDDMAEMIKLNSKIAREEQKIEDAYREIGKIYYKKYADKGDVLFQDKIDSIRASERMILGEVKHMVTKLKGLIVCPSCGSSQPLGSIFCNVCGTKLMDNSGVVYVKEKSFEASDVEAPTVEKQEEEVSIVKETASESVVENPAIETPVESSAEEAPKQDGGQFVCKVCGTPMAADMLFCINCGTRREV